MITVEPLGIRWPSISSSSTHTRGMTHAGGYSRMASCTQAVVDGRHHPLEPLERPRKGRGAMDRHAGQPDRPGRGREDHQDPDGALTGAEAAGHDASHLARELAELLAEQGGADDVESQRGHCP